MTTMLRKISRQILLFCHIFDVTYFCFDLSRIGTGFFTKGFVNCIRTPGRFFFKFLVRTRFEFSRFMSEYTKAEEIRIPTPYGHIAGKVWGEPGAKPILGHKILKTFDTYTKVFITSESRLIVFLSVLRIRIRKILASWIRIRKNMRIPGSKGQNVNQKLPTTKNNLLSKPKSEILKKERL